MASSDLYDFPEGTVVSVKVGDGPWRERVVGQEGFTFKMGVSPDAQNVDYYMGTKPSLWQRFRHWLSSLFDLHLRFDGDLLTPAHPDDPWWYDEPAR